MFEAERRYYTKAGKLSSVRRTGTGFNIGSLLTPAIFMFLGWLLISGAIGWSKQLQWLALIGIGIWFLRK